MHYSPPMPERRTVIATCGHVDHGKTSLMRALTGTDTDRLPDEKRRGISIELGFAELPNSNVSFIDVPGHKRLVHAMIAGVGGVDAALLVVAADDGVMPQTREHLSVCQLLNVQRILVAITKTDLVDEETLAFAEEDVAQALADVELTASVVVHTSIETGAGIELLRRELHRLAGAIEARPPSKRVWLPIDRVFTVRGAGTVVTGTLTRGELSVGQTVFLTHPKGIRETTVRSLEVHGRQLPQLRAPSRVAINLARVELAEALRGEVLTADRELPRSDRLTVRVRALPDTDSELAVRAPVTIHVGTARSAARVLLRDDEVMHLRLEQPLPAEGGVGFVLRGFADHRLRGEVLGGGRVLDASPPRPPKRRDAARRAALQSAYAELSHERLGPALIELLALAAPRPLSAAELERRLGLEPDAAKRLLSNPKKGMRPPLSFEEGSLFAVPEAVDAIVTRIEQFLSEHHRRFPTQAGASLQTLRAETTPRGGELLFERALSRATRDATVQLVDGGVACLATFAEVAGPQAAARRETVLAWLADAALAGAREAEVLENVGYEDEAVKSALMQLQQAGSVRRLGGLWFAETQLERLRQRVAEHFGEHDSLGVAEFKELAGVSRKQAIPLLEQLDREGTTRRQGDARIAGPRLSA